MYRDTTFHTSLSSTWEALAYEVRGWRARYPNQRYYALRPVDPVATSRELDSLLAGLPTQLADVASGDRDHHDSEFDAFHRDCGLALTLSVLLAGAAAVAASGISRATPADG